MKTLLIALLFPLTASAQIDWKREILPLTCFFVAGTLEGTAETLKWHYWEFEAMHPNANADLWNPQLSWTRKYKGGNPANGPAYFGSTTFLAWTTDPYHAMRTSKNVLLMTGLLLTPDLKGQKWYIYLLKAAMYTAAYTSGFHLTYSLLYNSK